MAIKGSLDTKKKMVGKQGQLRTNGRETNNISKMGATGIYGANPSPALKDYKQSAGKDTIPIKFAESGIGTAKRATNKMRTVGMKERAEAPIPTTSTIMKGKNRYRSPMDKSSGMQKKRF